MGKDNLVIVVNWLWFQDEKTSQFQKHSIEWSGKCVYRNGSVHEKTGSSSDTKDLFQNLESWFGGELKDLNNECSVEITSGKEGIFGNTFMANKKYYIASRLSLEEEMELAAQINMLPQRGVLKMLQQTTS